MVVFGFIIGYSRVDDSIILVSYLYLYQYNRQNDEGDEMRQESQFSIERKEGPYSDS